jgi:hypothetical protein
VQLLEETRMNIIHHSRKSRSPASLGRLGAVGIALALLSPVGAATPADAAFPGLNGHIAFQSNRDGNFEIYVMNPDGSGQTRLTTAGGSDPSWSPDGTKIVFSTGRDGNGEIYVMNADGSGQTNVSNRPAASDTFPVWSADGSRIAFASYEWDQGNFDIWVMNADGSGQANLTSNPAEDIFPTWEPGGSKIAFQTNRDGDREVYTMNPDGSDAANLTNSPATEEEEPDWAPDGLRIAFVSTRDSGGLYVMAADGSTVIGLNSTSGDTMPAWSPDGQKIVFMSRRDLNDEIYVMNVDGSGATRLTNNAPPGNTLPEDWFPDWQPFQLVGPDTTPPTLQVPSDITVQATSAAGAVVTYSASAFDYIDPDPVVTCSPASGTTFPVGETTVTCSAVDDAGNTATATFTVAVLPLLDISIQINSTATVSQRTGVATVSGTVSCNNPTSGYIYGDLKQLVANRAVIGGSFFIGAQTCTPPGTSWTAAVSPDNGRYGAGKAEANASTFLCDEFNCLNDDAGRTITLRGVRP